MAAAARAAPTSSPRTPIGISSLSRELEEVIAQKNLLTCRSRRKLLTELEQSAQDGENKEMNSLRQRAIGELLQSEKSYLRHLEIVATYFMEPLRERRDWLSLQDHLTIFGDLPSILQVNRELLLSLETSTDQIGSVFLELAPYLKFYSTYAQDFQARFFNLYY